MESWEGQRIVKEIEELWIRQRLTDDKWNSGNNEVQGTEDICENNHGREQQLWEGQEIAGEKEAFWGTLRHCGEQRGSWESNIIAGKSSIWGEKWNSENHGNIRKMSLINLGIVEQ